MMATFFLLPKYGKICVVTPKIIVVHEQHMQSQEIELLT